MTSVARYALNGSEFDYVRDTIELLLNRSDEGDRAKIVVVVAITDLDPIVAEVRATRLW